MNRPTDFLRVSLRHWAQEHRHRERSARKAYTVDPMRAAAVRLADIHAASAALFENELRCLELAHESAAPAREPKGGV